MSVQNRRELDTAVAMARALRAREVSAVELVRAALERATAWQPAINAFSQLWADEALAAAQQVDDTPGETRPFAGVPLAVKDLFDVAGHETTGCCAAYRGRVAASDAPTIAAMRRAGLIIIGKTNQHELAAGGTNAVSACGPTHNPWDLTRVTGGSSGGSGAVVAAGIVPWALGSDTGGSIRIPASMCGIVGLKPTTGQLSTAGMLPLAPSLDCPGPMAGTVEDTAALYALLAGRDDLVAALVRPGDPAPTTRGAVTRTYRIGVPDGYFAANVHSDILAGVQSVAGLFQSGGAVVESVDGSGIDDTRFVWMDITYAEFAAAHPTLWRDHRDLVAPTVLDWMDRGTRVAPEKLAAARTRVAEIGQWFRAHLQHYDALLVPTLPYWAPVLGEQEIDLGANGNTTLAQVGPGWHTCAANLAGLPAISLPAGRSPQGLPFGVSLIGADHAEATILELATLWSTISDYQFSAAGR